jgi:hypothetical protein
MHSSTAVSRASTSPLCNADRRLEGAVVPSERLTAEDRRAMYALLEMYFSGTDRRRFEGDLQEKDAVILLRDAASGQVQGFSTFMQMSTHVDGQEVVAFFSGDTIVDREYWGETLLSRLWGRAIFAEADRIAAARPEARLYWFLICSGYKTWRFLPLFFREFYPNADVATPSHIKRILDTLAAHKFGNEYLPGPGIVRFRSAAPLRPGVADLTDQRLRDPRVAFFARMNPNHAQGDELACLAELSRTNLTRAAHRMLSGS